MSRTVLIIAEIRHFCQTEVRRKLDLKAKEVKLRVTEILLSGLNPKKGDGISHMINGYLIPNNDIPGAVERITERLRERELNLKMGSKGREFISNNLTATKVFSQIENIYAKFLAVEIS